LARQLGSDTGPRKANKQHRQEVAERFARSGAMSDATVADIQTEAPGYIRDYVARTLSKERQSPLAICGGFGHTLVTAGSAGFLCFAV
jgi:hypothetical protein